VADAVRHQLGDEQAQIVERLVLDRALEPVERVPSLAGSLRARPHVEAQVRDDLVAAEIDGRPAPALAPAPLEARERAIRAPWALQPVPIRVSRRWVQVWLPPQGLLPGGRVI